jgi:CheY-like chemotaxis protein
MKSIRILYFDDEKWMSGTLQKNLQETYPQYQIYRVSTIQLFLAELQSHERYDLIMLDIMAPMALITENDDVRKKFSITDINGMSDGLNIGEILYREVRAINWCSEIPVLFYSAKQKVNIQDSNTAFIRKPEFANVIHDKIQSLLNLA